MNKRYNWIGGWLSRRFGERIYKISLESGLGCPNRNDSGGCIFCNMASYSPATAPDGSARKQGIRDQLREGIEYVRNRHHANKFIAYFQSGSNTYASASFLNQLFEDAISHPDVVGLAVSTRPDCIDDGHVQMLDGLSKKKFVWIELGLQSAHDKTLDQISRGHTRHDFETACGALRKGGIPVCAHVILGLPGETPDMMKETARFINSQGIWGIKIHNLHVLKETKLAELYKEGGVFIPELETYATWVADFLEQLNPEIVIHRVNGHSPRRITIAPEWSVNKLAIFDAVDGEMERRNTFQGKLFGPSA